jgi:AraC-like DNA-binding protein
VLSCAASAAWKGLALPLEARQCRVLSAVDAEGSSARAARSQLFAAAAAAVRGALDYALSTASTLREAIALTAEYMHLVSDVFRATLELDGARARLCIDSDVPLSVAAQDFGMASFYTSHVRHWVRAPHVLRIWLARSTPADVTPFLAAYAPWELRFCAPSAAFDFPSALLDQPLAGTDAGLHRAIMDELHALASELPRPDTLSAQVSAFLDASLAQGLGDAVHAAEHLGLSVRTLGRRLEREGTSFRALLDSFRRKRAFTCLSQGRMKVSDIARATGFAEVATFHRAFKRWALQTPGNYRDASGG